MLRARRSSDTVLVLGLGRFGGAVAQQLVDLDLEVLAVDADAGRVQEWADRLTHVVQGDSTDPAVLTQLGAGEYSRAVVAIGDLEASILTVTALVDLGVPQIWAKALTSAHGRILERVGAHTVVFPEHEMGRRVGHQVSGRAVDFFRVGAFALAEVRVSPELAGGTLRERRLRTEHAVSVLALSGDGGATFDVAHADAELRAGDLLVVAGREQDVERFTARYC